MKLTHLLLIAGLSGFCTVAIANSGKGDRQNVSVSKAKTLRDDSRVVLQGKITGRAGDDDLYWLEDSSGRIRIDVDDDDDGRHLIGKKVRVVGDVDHHDGHVEIEVDHLRRLN